MCLWNIKRREKKRDVRQDPKIKQGKKNFKSKVAQFSSQSKVAKKVVAATRLPRQDSGNCIQYLQEHLQGSRFRNLNERLYNQSTKSSFKMFRKDPSLYNVYHEGYEHQRGQWPQDPLLPIVSFVEILYRQYRHFLEGKHGTGAKVKPKSASFAVADLGCGTGRLAELLHMKVNKTSLTDESRNAENTSHENFGDEGKIGPPLHIENMVVHSFDYVALRPFIEIADCSNLPLKENSMHVVVFCLSLMGENFLDSLIEAYRVLKPRSPKSKAGRLLICEVTSRIQNPNEFIELLEAVGFVQVKNQVRLKGGEDMTETKSQGKSYFTYFAARKDFGILEKTQSDPYANPRDYLTQRRKDILEKFTPSSILLPLSAKPR